MSKTKILWFIPGAASPEQKVQAQAHGLSIRNPLAYSEGVGLEDCDGVTGMAPKAYGEKFGVIDEPEGLSWYEGGLRGDGPTVDEYVSAGYPAANYPPEGYASRSTEDEVDAAVAAQKGTGDGKVSIAEVRAVLTAKGIAFDPKASKAELIGLLNAPSAAEAEAAELDAIKVELTEKGIQFAEAASLDELKALLLPKE